MFIALILTIYIASVNKKAAKKIGKIKVNDSINKEEKPNVVEQPIQNQINPVPVAPEINQPNIQTVNPGVPSQPVAAEPQVKVIRKMVVPTTVTTNQNNVEPVQNDNNQNNIIN